MRNQYATPFIGWVGAWLCTISLAWSAEGGPTGAELLPPETRLMFTIPSVPEIVDRFNASPGGEMLADPAFQPFLDQIREKLGETSDKLKEEIGLTLEDLATLPTGEFTFALVEKPARKLHFVLMLDCTGKDESVNTLVEKVTDGLGRAGAETKSQTVGEIDIQIFEFPKSNDFPYNRLAHFTHDGYWVLSSDVAPLQAVIERWEGKKRDTLANAQIYSYIMEKVGTEGREPGTAWYIDFMGLVKAGIGMAAQQIPNAGLALGVLPILGLDGLKGMGGIADTDVEDFEMINRTFIYVEQPVAGILGVMQFPATEQMPPKWVDADTAMYMGVSWDVEQAYASIESLVDSFQSPEAMKKMIDQLAEDESGPMIHIKDELIDNLGGHIHVTMEPLPETPSEDEGENAVAGEFIAAISVKDSDQMQATLEKASKSDGFPGEVEEVEGVTVYTMPLDGDMQLQVCVVDNHLIIASSREELEDVIAGKTEEALVDSDAFQAAAKHFPKSTSMLSFSRSNSQIKAVIDMLKQQAGDELGIDLSTLPDFEAFEKYLKPQVGYYIPDENGALGVGFSLKGE
jgi:hypothetical protein